MKRLSIILALLYGLPAFGQCAGVTSCSVASPYGPTQWQAALNSINTDGTVLSVPASNTTWTSGVTYTQTNSFTIQGAGAISAPNWSGVPSYPQSPSGTDQTIIQDNNAGNALFTITLISGKSFRMTGIAWQYSLSNGTQTFNGPLQFNGISTSFRFDHNHINQINLVDGQIQGWIEGVVDHNWFDEFYSDTNGFRVGHPQWNNESGPYGAWGNKSWADGDHWGTSQFLFMENNVFNWTGATSNPSADFGAADDCNNGGRIVFRYNLIQGLIYFQTHEMEIDGRGCRATEIYGNTAVASNNPSTTTFAFFYNTRMGTGLVWGNVLTAYQQVADFAQDRTNEGAGEPHPFDPPPTQGWGYCGKTTDSGVVNTSGTSVTWVSGTMNFTEGHNSAGSGAGSVITINGVNYTISSYPSATTATLTTSAGTQTGVAFYVSSPWDQNPTNSYGYACVDQIGRGQGQLITGYFLNNCCSGTGNKINSVSGIASWPNNVQDPQYVFDNTFNAPSSAVGYATSNAPTTVQENRDYFLELPNFSESATFNGTAGVGHGTLAPTNSGAYSGAPTCTNFTAYWQSSANTLWQCQSGTWVSYYTPFTYPHPLITGSASAPSCTPTSGVVPQTVTCTNPNTGTTVMCYAASPTTPATNGAGTGCNTGTVYTTTLSITSAETLEIIAGVAGESDSSVSSYTYTASPVAPTVTTTTATGITTTGATAGGTVTSNGGASVTSEGTCYATTANPTTPCTSDGTATPFTSTLSGLTPGTVYHYRAFATNSAGTGYGSDLTFTTVSSCAFPTSIGIYTVCNQAYNDVASGTTSSVTISPFVGNGVEIFGQYCANTSCNAAPSATATISDNVNSPETCFTVSPHSPYNFANTFVPDYERIYAWYCPSIPSGVTTFTITTSVAVNYLQLDVVEWKAGTIASTGYFENVDNLNSAGNVAGTTATVSTTATTVNANDLITSMIANCGGTIPATVGAGYTGIIVNPSTTPGHITQAKAVTGIGVQTSTTTWSSGSASSACNLGAGGSNDTWFGVIVPLIGANQSTPVVPPATILLGSVIGNGVGGCIPIPKQTELCLAGDGLYICPDGGPCRKFIEAK